MHPILEQLDSATQENLENLVSELSLEEMLQSLRDLQADHKKLLKQMKHLVISRVFDQIQ